MGWDFVLLFITTVSASVVAVAHPKGGGMGLSVRKSRRDGFESRPGA